MATTEPEEVEDTIRSRSQHFHFRVLTFNEISDRLKFIATEEKLQIDDGALSVIARMAEGSMRDALSLLEQARAYCGDTIADHDVRELLGVVPEDALQELVEAIAEHSADRALELVHRFQREGRNLQHFCREAIRHMRNLLIARVCGAGSDLVAATPDQRPAIAKAAALFSEEDLTRFFQILLQTDDDVRRKMDPRVHLEMGLLRLVNAARLAPLEELLAEARGTSGGGSGSSKSAAQSSAGASVPPRSMPATVGSFAGTLASEELKTPASHLGGQAESGRYKIVPTAIESPRAEIASKPVSGIFGGGGSAAAAPALAATEEIAARMIGAETADSERLPMEQAAKVAAAGLDAEQVAEIKAGIQAQQKFIAELVERASRWELEGSELRIYFSPENGTYAGLLEGRDTLEKIRGVANRVLGRAVRVCARLDSSGANVENSQRSAGSTQELRAQFENDPIVKSMLQRFGGRISEVRRQKE